MKLTQLVTALSALNPRLSGGNPEIAGLSYRSGETNPGDLFVAVAGTRADGHDFTAEAQARGAAALVVQRPVEGGVPTVRVDDSRRALPLLAACLHGFPAESLTLVGVTGTNGKTTVSYLIESILTAAGHPAGVIGTVSYRFGGRETAAQRTTPEAPDLQRLLAEMRTSGVTHVVLEAASHGIAQGRIDGAWLDVGVFTNLSQDHLDYHGDMAGYWACKKSLFTTHMARGPKARRARAVVNCGDARGRELFVELEGSGRSISTGRSSRWAVHPTSVAIDREGIRCRIVTPDGDFGLNSALVGAHNLDNLLSAAGAGLALGIGPATIRDGLQGVQCVPGRLERVAPAGGRFVYVDYAHTPDALENVLCVLRELSDRRLICVFGCGGDRDRGKRPLMGAIAARACDLAVVTSDNPRSEDPLAIIEAIRTGMETGPTPPPPLSADRLVAGPFCRGHVVEPDRRAAIQLAVRVCRPGDTLLIAGKGHETYQTVGGRDLPFDDAAEARAALSALSGRGTAS